MCVCVCLCVLCPCVCLHVCVCVCSMGSFCKSMILAGNVRFPLNMLWFPWIPQCSWKTVGLSLTIVASRWTPWFLYFPDKHASSIQGSNLRMEEYTFNATEAAIRNVHPPVTRQPFSDNWPSIRRSTVFTFNEDFDPHTIVCPLNPVPHTWWTDTFLELVSQITDRFLAKLVLVPNIFAPNRTVRWQSLYLPCGAYWDVIFRAFHRLSWSLPEPLGVWPRC